MSRAKQKTCRDDVSNQHVIVGSRNLKRTVKNIKWDKCRRSRTGFVTFSNDTHQVWERPEFWTDFKFEQRGSTIHYLFEDALSRRQK